MNKHERYLAGRKVAMKRAKKCKWEEDWKDLPRETQITFQTTGHIRISQTSDKKHFKNDNNQPRKYYGHFTGTSQRHLPKKKLIERVNKKEDLQNINEL